MCHMQHCACDLNQKCCILVLEGFCLACFLDVSPCFNARDSNERVIAKLDYELIITIRRVEAERRWWRGGYCPRGPGFDTSGLNETFFPSCKSVSVPRCSPRLISLLHIKTREFSLDWVFLIISPGWSCITCPQRLGSLNCNEDNTI